MKWIPLDAIPGVTILPHWQAPKYTPGGLIDERAALWHMAQGGGADTWLTRQDGAQGNNSSHIVVKYSGAIRQIVSLEDAAWSLHIDRPDGPPDGPLDDGLFSLDAAQRVLGTAWRNPNAYGIAIEIEGYAETGPNEAQKVTMVALAKYLERLFPRLKHLGHRDFQDYKRCPGIHIFNEILPHEGRVLDIQPTPTPEPEPPMHTFALDPKAGFGWLTVKTDNPHWYLRLKDGTLQGPINPATFGRRRAFGPVRLLPGIGDNSDARSIAYIVGTEAAALLATDVDWTPDPDVLALQTENAAIKKAMEAADKEDEEIAAQLNEIAAKLAA